MAGITKWHTLVAGLWVSLGCGYWGTFGTISPALKARYELHDPDVSTIGIGTTVVGFVTFTGGIYTDHVGVTIGLVSGLLLNMLGWFLYGFIAVNDLHPMPPVVMFTGLAMLATYGAGLLTGALFKVITSNFTAGRSTAVGIAKAWVGLASGFTSMVYVAFFPSEDTSPERLYFIWFLVANLAIFVMLPIPFLRILKLNEDDSLDACSRARFAYLLIVTLILIMLTVIIAVVKENLSSSVAKTFAIVLVSFVLLPWLSLLPRAALDSRESLTSRTGEEQEEVTPSPWAGGPRQMLSRIEAWLLWFCIFALMSGGVVLTTNFGDITASRSGPHVLSASAVAVFSAAQALGRLTGGSLSDVVVHLGLARPWYFAVLSAGMAVAHAVLCIPGPAALYIGTMVAGYAFGSTYPLMIVTILELFGAERIASNYMFYDGTPVGMASLLVAKAYAQTVEQHQQSGDNCSGDACFTMTYVGIIVLQVVSITSACVLACRSTIVYRDSVFKKNADLPNTESVISTM